MFIKKGISLIGMVLKEPMEAESSSGKSKASGKGEASVGANIWRIKVINLHEHAVRACARVREPLCTAGIADRPVVERAFAQ